MTGSEADAGPRDVAGTGGRGAPGTGADVAVWFDLDGTLLHLGRPYGAVLRGAFGRHLDGAALDRAVDAYDFLDRFRGLEPDPYRAATTAAADAAGADVDPSALLGALREVEYAATTVPEGTRRTLSALDAPLGVLTNGLPEWQRGKLTHRGLLGPFESVVASYEAGAHKPDAAPFHLARERLPADRHLMVGDDRGADVEGGRAAGFEAVHAPDGIASVRGELRALL